MDKQRKDVTGTWTVPITEKSKLNREEVSVEGETGGNTHDLFHRRFAGKYSYPVIAPAEKTVPVFLF